MVDSILKDNPVARTPVTRPTPGMKYEHLNHGVVRVTTVEDGMVVFDRPWGTDGQAYLNERQQSVRKFAKQTVDVR